MQLLIIEPAGRWVQSGFFQSSTVWLSMDTLRKVQSISTKDLWPMGNLPAEISADRRPGKLRLQATPVSD